MQLVACEPDILEPVAIAYDENGLLYVAEYLKFPTVHGKSDRGDGRIRLLNDTDGDGRYESSAVFAEGLAWPTGICPWKGGVFVIAAPDLWYLKDTDGDHVADLREKWFTGFGFTNEEGTANNLIWGVDHWIYGAGSNSGGVITRADNDAESESQRPTDIAGRDFRFHPVTREFQAISGAEQFGNSFDDFFDRFICQNSKPVVHVVLPARYLARNPFVSVSSVRRDIWQGNEVFRASPVEPWRVARTEIRNAMGRNWEAPLVRHDVFTATSGATIYRGNAYPPEYRGNLFVGDVQSNLVHRRVMKHAGVSFDAIRAEEGTEILRSTDNWFRPANLCNAPDGTLHIVDMYREVIETPDSMPEEILRRLDLASGHEYGRIYRLAPKGFVSPKPPQLGSSSIEQLVQHLENENGWWRDTAQRLIYERQDSAAIAPLRALFRQSIQPLARLHAMYALRGLDALEDDDLRFALGDSEAGVCRHAVQLAESRLDKNPRLLTAVLGLSNHANPKVRFQVAFSLGELDRSALQQPEVVEALVAIIRRDRADPWIRAAVYSSSLYIADRTLLALWDDDEFSQHAGETDVVRQLAVFIGAASDAETIQSCIEYIETRSESASAQQREFVMGLARGLEASGKSLRTLAQSSPATLRLVNAALDEAKSALKDAKASAEIQIASLETLIHAEYADAAPYLETYLDPRRPPAVQVATIRALASFSDASAAHVLIDAWPKLSPAVRGEAAEALFSRNESTLQLLDAVKKGAIPIAHIDPTRRVQLQAHPSQQIRETADELFSGMELSPRNKVLADFQAALAQEGDAQRGSETFAQHCATCHSFKRQGHPVGPDLATAVNKSPEELLVQILDPNREIQSNYQRYLVTLVDGRQVTGMILAETPTSITLQRAENVQQTVLRTNIDEIHASGLSLMPEGLELNIGPKQMSDLLAYLLTSGN